MYLLFRRHASALYRAFGNPFGGGGDECSGFHPPWDFECSQSTSTTSTHEATSTTKTAAPVPTQTTVVVSSTVITSVTVVTSGSTTTAETTLITGTTVTSAITPTPPPSGSSSSGTATEPSATDESPSVSNSSEPTALPDRTTIGSDISPLPTPLSPSPSIQTTTVSTTLSPTGASSGQQQVHNLSGGDIAAICIACLSVLGLSVIILRASKKRAANAGRRSSHSTPGTDAASTTPQANASDHSARHSGRPLSPGDPRLSSPGALEANLNANEKGNLEFGYLARGASTSSSHSSVMSPSTALGPSPLSPSLLSHAASSPTSATALLPMAFDDAMVTPTALSPHVLSPAVTIPATSSPGDSTSTALSPAIASPIVASPATVPARRFRGAWDDPPPTPEYRPLSLQMNEVVTFVHPEALHTESMPPANEESVVQRNPAFRDSVLGDGRSEVEGDQLPEYSRY